jgi:hypothetical protein
MGIRTRHDRQDESAARALKDYLAIETQAFAAYTAAKRAAWQDYLAIHDPAFKAYHEAVTKTKRRTP